MSKKTKIKAPKLNKQSARPQNFSSANLAPVWTFTNVDRDGKFAFNPYRSDVDAEEFLDKLIAFSKMTWQEIENPKSGKHSRHHELNADSLSAVAIERIKVKGFDQESDSIFSFALSGKKRVVGIRKSTEFQVVWYDANHEFAPSDKKHT